MSKRQRKTNKTLESSRASIKSPAVTHHRPNMQYRYPICFRLEPDCTTLRELDVNHITIIGTVLGQVYVCVHDTILVSLMFSTLRCYRRLLRYCYSGDTSFQSWFGVSLFEALARFLKVFFWEVSNWVSIPITRANLCCLFVDTAPECVADSCPRSLRRSGRFYDGEVCFHQQWCGKDGKSIFIYSHLCTRFICHSRICGGVV